MKTKILVVLALSLLLFACAKQAGTELPPVPKPSSGIQAPSAPSTAPRSGPVDLTLDVPTGKLAASGQFDTATKIDVAGRVMNSGSGDSGDFTITLYANDEKIYDTSMRLGAGKKQTFEYFWKPPATGDYRLKLVIDSGNDVAETDEKNNVFELPLPTITEPSS